VTGTSLGKLRKARESHGKTMGNLWKTYGNSGYDGNELEKVIENPG
jgi:hypothetical protein